MSAALTVEELKAQKAQKIALLEKLKREEHDIVKKADAVKKRAAIS